MSLGEKEYMTVPAGVPEGSGSLPPTTPTTVPPVAFSGMVRSPDRGRVQQDPTVLLLPRAMLP